MDSNFDFFFSKVTLNQRANKINRKGVFSFCFENSNKMTSPSLTCTPPLSHTINLDIAIEPPKITGFDVSLNYKTFKYLYKFRSKQKWQLSAGDQLRQKMETRSNKRKRRGRNLSQLLRHLCETRIQNLPRYPQGG